MENLMARFMLWVCRQWCSWLFLHVLRPAYGRLECRVWREGQWFGHVDYLCHKHLVLQNIIFGVRKTHVES